MIEAALYDPVVVDLTLGPEKVAELLRRGYESPKLDYKSEIDHSSTPSVQRLVKHVLAMANTVGGYIILGVKDDGQREGLTPEQCRRLDDATVQAWVRGYTSVPCALAVHNSVEFEGGQYVVLAVLGLTDRLAVAMADAQYQDPNGKNQFVFRRGDVLVRHGTSSERWLQADADFLIARARQAQKELWRREFAADYAGVQGLLAETTPTLDASAFTLPSDEFHQLALKLLRAKNG
jgi:hypothetical protein